MATSFNFPTLQGPLLHKSHFLGHTQFTQRSLSSFPTPNQSSHQVLIPSAKFNIYEILGGRGLCNGEEGLQQELKRPPPERSPPPTTTANQEDVLTPPVESVPENAFEKELLGLIGGFPGGEKGLKQFIEKKPPSKKSPPPSTAAGLNQSLARKPKASELPLLMPGMIAIVKNPNNPYHRYCGIVQTAIDYPSITAIALGLHI